MKQITLIRFVRRYQGTKEYWEINNQARIRAGYKCEVCGGCGSAAHSIMVHHKDRNFLNNSPENLQVLCPSCHQKIHDRMREKDIRERVTLSFGDSLVVDSIVQEVV